MFCLFKGFINHFWDPWFAKRLQYSIKKVEIQVPNNAVYQYCNEFMTRTRSKEGTSWFVAQPSNPYALTVFSVPGRAGCYRTYVRTTWNCLRAHKDDLTDTVMKPGLLPKNTGPLCKTKGPARRSSGASRAEPKIIQQVTGSEPENLAGGGAGVLSKGGIWQFRKRVVVKPGRLWVCSFQGPQKSLAGSRIYCHYWLSTPRKTKQLHCLAAPELHSDIYEPTASNC